MMHLLEQTSLANILRAHAWPLLLCSIFTGFVPYIIGAAIVLCHGLGIRDFQQDGDFSPWELAVSIGSDFVFQLHPFSWLTLPIIFYVCFLLIYMRSVRLLAWTLCGAAVLPIAYLLVVKVMYPIAIPDPRVRIGFDLFAVVLQVLICAGVGALVGAIFWCLVLELPEVLTRKPRRTGELVNTGE